MKIAQASTVGLIGMALLIGTAAVGCGSDEKDSSASSSSSSTSAAATTSAAASETTSAAASPSAQSADYSKLLLKASDIDPSFTASEPVVNPNGLKGIVQTMTNPQNQTIVFAIVVNDDAAGALKALDSAKAELPKEVDGAPQPADVGDGGNSIIATGKSPDGSKGITEVYFTQGKALVNIEFSSAPNDPVLPETALAVAKMQDTQVKNNLT
jgi:cytoskeletal protein RodZ